MKARSVSLLYFEQTFLRPIFLLLFFIMALTGFGQMPIFKRYYLADVPGLGWLAQFYVTHAIHYIGAALFLLLVVYCAAMYLGALRVRFKLTSSAYVKIALLAAIVGTGFFRVFKNFPDVVFSPGFTMFIDISHLVFVMAFIVVGIITIFTKSPWLREVN
jgi:hypothetical protein